MEKLELRVHADGPEQPPGGRAEEGEGELGISAALHEAQEGRAHTRPDAPRRLRRPQQRRERHHRAGDKLLVQGEAGDGILLDLQPLPAFEALAGAFRQRREGVAARVEPIEDESRTGVTKPRRSVRRRRRHPLQDLRGGVHGPVRLAERNIHDEQGEGNAGRRKDGAQEEHIVERGT